ncbi:hypothetical protein TNCV_3933921 [Trichonephila clavipes]|nr:hypothetical protein TNCV_3933921 [Trichonephila clavipes]
MHSCLDNSTSPIPFAFGDTGYEDEIEYFRKPKMDHSKIEMSSYSSPKDVGVGGIEEEADRVIRTATFILTLVLYEVYKFIT